jgi:hypothetical protein
MRFLECLGKYQIEKAMKIEAACVTDMFVSTYRTAQCYNQKITDIRT